MLDWAEQFSILLFLDTNSYELKHSRYECLMAVDSIEVTPDDNILGLSELQELHDKHKDWLFGHICYDYKNELEPKLKSEHPHHIGFPEFYFFRPQVVIYIDKDRRTLHIESVDITPDEVYHTIMLVPEIEDEELPKLKFSLRTEKQQYISNVNALKQHIKDGDCYEINYCVEGYCEKAHVEPLSVFHALNKLSPAPFAAFYRFEDKHLICASPERYLMKVGDTIISQPIKGTARRDADPAKDAEIKTALSQSIKDKAENVMIVDLVRNDLARCCETGSVQVDELYGIYSFPQVHQMISTVSGKLRKDAPLTDAIRTTFPMGSMTGAPKIKVMELIERYENSRRELYSGTVGYITPDGDFDFNVVIRSLYYDYARHYLSFQAGGAITYDSDPEAEWNEMRLKAWALERIFS